MGLTTLAIVSITLAVMAGLVSLWRAVQGYQKSTALFISNIALICFNVREVFTASLLLIVGAIVYVVELEREERGKKNE